MKLTERERHSPGALLQNSLGGPGPKVVWDKCQECGGEFPDDDAKWRERSVKQGVVGVKHAGGCD